HRGRGPKKRAQRNQHRPARPSIDHELKLYWVKHRNGNGDCPNLFAARGELPELARSIHYSDGTYRCAGRCYLGTSYHEYNLKRSRDDGRNHVPWRRYREFGPCRDLRSHSLTGRKDCFTSSVGSWDRPFAPSDHDGDGDDHRYVSNGSWSR